jgi:hypothetical protein
MSAPIFRLRPSSFVDETKTHEDDDDPGVVPIIQPLRLMLDQI